MLHEKSYIVLLVQSAHVVFCYYRVHSDTIKEFNNIYGKGSWEESEPALKVYEAIDGEEKEIETIYIDPFADNWYIKLNNCSIKVFVKLGRILSNGEFIPVAISNTVTTPRDIESSDREIAYLDVSDFQKKGSV